MVKFLSLKSFLLITASFIMPIWSGTMDSKDKKDPVVPGGPDTTYHTVTNTIYSITEKDPSDTSLTTKYTVYYLNGDIQYYCTYEYTNTVLTKINYFDGQNKKYAHGTYAANSIGGYDYVHYASDGTLISKTEYDANWISNQFTAYTSQQNLKYKVVNTIKDGYITNEKYYNEKNVLYGEGVWSWVPTTQVTIYTYTVKNGIKLTHSVTGEEYDRYETYYCNYLKDSLKLYDGEINESNLVYTAKYAYDENGYMTGDNYFKDGVLKSFGNYTFDKGTFITAYSYKLTPDTLLWTTTYDYRNYNLKTEYYSKDNKIESIVSYEYDKYANYKKLTKKNAEGKLISYETYSYYDPYSFVKEYTAYDSSDNKTAHITYDIYGNITSKDSVKKKKYFFNKQLFSTDIDVNNQQIIFDIKGRIIGRKTERYLDFRAASGVYISKLTNVKKVKISLP